MTKRAIGLFDSGSGGLTILKEVQQQLPLYDYMYFGDHAHAPYGNKSFEEIYRYTLRAVEFLAEKNCPLIIIACNTVSAKALRNIQQLWLPHQQRVVRVLGIIIPTAEEVILLSKNKCVGILATEATVSSETFITEIKKLDPKIKVYQQACPSWVRLVEEKINYNETNIFSEVRKCIQQLFSQSKEIDTLILGCTHYPLLWPFIKQFIPPHVCVLQQGSIIAKKLIEYLKKHPEIDALCTKWGDTCYLTSGAKKSFEEKAMLFMNNHIVAEKVSF